ncbi:MAG: hypothetical protein FJW97_08970 [Actinobacteria bacterium]|nr:hypothetical protein [Actinomycetota bacterium]
MKRPVVTFVLALVSVVLSPTLIFFEMVALLFADMVNYEPSNSTAVKVLTVVIVIAIGAIALAVPIIALAMSSKVRAASTVTPIPRAGIATAAMVIAGIVTAGVVLAQVYMILMVFGKCSLEGCQF